MTTPEAVTPKRVVAWSTGTIGRHAIAGIDARPDLELVGLWVSNPDKVGQDAGRLAGLDRDLGVLATNDKEALYALKPDAVLHSAMTDDRIFDALEDLVEIVEHGINVISSGPVVLTFPDGTGLDSYVDRINAAGAEITAQVFARPIGLVIGLELTANPFALYPSYQEIADLPLDQRVAQMRKPEVRARILADKPGEGHPFMYFAQAWEWMFPFTEPANYEPAAQDSILARAQARGVSPLDEAYDRLLDDDGRAMMLVALANFENNSLDTVGELIRRDDVVLGLGDGGAHYGMICDASYPTFVLAHWARDRPTGRLSVAEAVRLLTSVPARVAGLADRGRIAVGYKADLNVIDHAGLTLHKPVITHDLPAGGRRLDQTADGYVATIVSGEVIATDGVPTSARPGRLIRGRQAAPVA